MIRTAFSAAVAALAFAASTAFAAPIEATSSGTFVNPTGPAGMVTTGTGTNDFTWGQLLSGPQNRLVFDGNDIVGETGTELNLGRLSYTNGTIVLGTEAESVSLAVQLAFSVPAIPSQTFDYLLNLIITPNTGDPDASADAALLPSVTSSTEFIVGDDTYTLRITGFDNVVGDGFLTSDATRLNVREGRTATADLIGSLVLVPGEGGGEVPTPAPLMLMGIGLLALAGLRRGRRAA